MIELRADSLEIPIGQTFNPHIDAAEPDVETRLFLRHEGVRYPLCYSSCTVSAARSRHSRFSMRVDYGYRDAQSTATFASGAEVCKRFGDTVFQIVGAPGGAVGA